MAERDPEFEQDVLRIVYAALADREALAAAMSEQQLMPVAGAGPRQQDPPEPSGSSPFEVGVRGGAPPPIPPLHPFRCGDTRKFAYEELGFPEDTETQLAEIEHATGATREQVVQEAMRRALRDKIAELRGLI